MAQGLLANSKQKPGPNPTSKWQIFTHPASVDEVQPGVRQLDGPDKKLLFQEMSRRLRRSSVVVGVGRRPRHFGDKNFLDKFQRLESGWRPLVQSEADAVLKARIEKKAITFILLDQSKV